jgi:hypothetical protein
MEGKKKSYMHDMEQWGAAAAEVRKMSVFHDDVVGRESLASGRRTGRGRKFAGADFAAMMTVVVVMCAHVYVGAVRGIKVCADAGMPATVRCGPGRGGRGLGCARNRDHAAALLGWLHILCTAWDTRAEERGGGLNKTRRAKKQV